MDREIINEILNGNLEQTIQQCLQNGDVIVEDDNNLLVQLQNEITIRIVKKNCKICLNIELQNINNLGLVDRFKQLIESLDGPILERACEIYNSKSTYNIPLSVLDKLISDSPRGEKTAREITNFISCIKVAIDEKLVEYKNTMSRVDQVIPSIDNLN